MIRTNRARIASFAGALTVIAVVGWWYFFERMSVPERPPGAAHEKASSPVTARSLTQREQWDIRKAQNATQERNRKPNYREALGAPDVTAEIRRLTASPDPNDWYKATVLNIKCTGVFHDNAEIGRMTLGSRRRFGTAASEASPQAEAAWLAKEMEAFEKTEYYQVRVRVKRQCGEAARSLLPLEPDLLRRARDRGATLALAPLGSWDNFMNGLNPEQQELVRAVLADAEGRTAWLSQNNQRITAMIESSGVFPGASRGEIISALILSLCYLGDDCGANSLHTRDLCNASFGCTTGSVEDSIFAFTPQNRMPVVTATALALIDGIQGGDLSSIGMVKVNPPKR